MENRESESMQDGPMEDPCVIGSEDETPELTRGLTQVELRYERLEAGDTIEYYSMLFVSGDARGYRVAKILRVLSDDKRFPLRLDTQELLPSTLLVRRKRNKQEDAIPNYDRTWRKIRTFDLIQSSVEGTTRSVELNKSIGKHVQSAIQTAFANMRRKSQPSHLDASPIELDSPRPSASPKRLKTLQTQKHVRTSSHPSPRRIQPKKRPRPKSKLPLDTFIKQVEEVEHSFTLYPSEKSSDGDDGRPSKPRLLTLNTNLPEENTKVQKRKDHLSFMREDKAIVSPKRRKKESKQLVLDFGRKE